MGKRGDSFGRDFPVGTTSPFLKPTFEWGKIIGRERRSFTKDEGKCLGGRGGKTLASLYWRRPKGIKAQKGSLGGS